MQGPDRVDRFPRRWVDAAVFTAIIVGILARFIALDADPRYGIWEGHLIDEARWTEQGRSVVLFGELALENPIGRMHLLLAPLYQAVSAVLFMIFGVGIATARSFSAASGALVILGVFFLIRRQVPAQPLVFALLIVGLQPDLLVVGRSAIPEAPALLFELLAFAFLVSKPRSAARAFFGGLAMAVALGLKSTSLLSLPVIAAVILVAHDEEDPASRIRRLAAFATAVVVPGALFVGALWVVQGSGMHPPPAAVAHNVLGFLEISDLYGVFQRPFYGDIAGPLNALLLPAWIIAVALLAAGRLPSGARDMYLASAVWAGGHFVVGSLVTYFPVRYQVHGLVPIAINIATGLALIREIGWGTLVDRFDRLPPLGRVLVASGLALPLATLMASPVVSLAGSAGITLDRLRHHVVLLGLFGAGLVTVTLAVWSGRRVVLGLGAFPLLLLAARRLLTLLGVPHVGHWVDGGGVAAGAWLASGVLAAAAVSLLARHARQVLAVRTAGAVYAVVLVCTWLAYAGPRILAPTYTVVSAGRALPEVIPEGSVVGAVGSGSLFLENELRYRDGLADTVGLEYAVIAFADSTEVARSLALFPHRVRSFPVNFGERYPEDRWQGITVFRREP